MLRQAVVGAPKRKLNSLARNQVWGPFIKQLFGPDFLPPKADTPRFKPDEKFAGICVSDLYLDSREWEDDIDYEPESDSYRHEKYLDNLFWNEKTSLAERIICVLGAVGSGKSTLIDYYLRCYCPNLGSRQEDFERKLIVSFDARMSQSRDDFSSNFFHAIQADIRDQCSSKHFDIDSVVRRRITKAKINVRSWVWYALEALSEATVATASGCPFSYIVVVVDNLDQCSLEVQMKAINQVQV